MERKREDCDGKEESLLVAGAGCCPNSCLCIPYGDYNSLYLAKVAIQELYSLERVSYAQS